MQIVIDIPDEKVNKYGVDVLEMSLTFSDRVITQADGYAFCQLPEGHGRLKDVDALEVSTGTVDDWEMEDFVYLDEIEKAPTIIEADKAESGSEVGS